MFIKTTAPNDKLIEQLIPVLEQASQILLSEYQAYQSGHHFEVQHKQDESPVTQADLKVNQFLMTALMQIDPLYPIISEESEHSTRHQWQTCWLLDPLDGTKEFLHRREEFTINLSLVSHGKTLFSCIVVPCEHQIYLGHLDEMPYKYQFNSKEWWCYQVVGSISQVTSIGLSHNSRHAAYQQFIQALQERCEISLRPAGSAYKFCLMLEGQIDLYPRFHPTSEWDTSAGQGLLESIGGGLMSLNAHEFTYNQRDTLLNHSFIAFTTLKAKHLALDVLAQL